MRAPRATYRIQFNEDFTFADATEIVPYLDALGVSHLYASPYTKARPGSTHGYDVVDHNALNPEIGSAEEYGRMVEALHERGMGQVLDIVPNHRGIGSDNERWLDVLENGPASPNAYFFDIDWYPTNRKELYGKVLLPVLGDHYRATLENDELKMFFDPEEGTLAVRYYEHVFPLDPKTYPMVLEDPASLSKDEQTLEFESLLTAFGNLPSRDETNAEKLAERIQDAAVNKGRLARLCVESAEVSDAVERCVRRMNGRAGDPESFGALHQVLEGQAYRLVYWRVASDEINYRRFFSINDLAGIRVEDERVFEETHRLVLDLVREGKVDGLRIDHPDGLYDPAGYLRRLQREAAQALNEAEPGEQEEQEEQAIYLIVEKILAHHERLPEDWPVAGTTGYDFTNLVNGLFVDSSGEEGLERAYRRFLGRRLDFEELLYGCKQLIMRYSLASELNVLSRRLLRISEGPGGRRSFDFTINVLRDGLSEVVAAFPVYRTYATAGSVSESDRRYVEWAVARARKRSTVADTSVFDFIREVLLLEVDGLEEYRASVAAFVMKFQQYTGPVMAKGMEDTALYIYNRLTSLNEVGGEPERFRVSVSAFHHLTAERLRDWPHAMLGTSTHDTKRGEDVRARINVLSEIPNEWRERIVRWARINRSRRRDIEGELAPSRNDEYLLYQTLLGAWLLGEMDEDALGELRERIKAYMEKAIREAQVHTSWIQVNEEYEAAVAAFLDALLSPENNIFLEDLIPFASRIARAGALNSLSQTLVKLTSPGVPDIYQGNELWDLSLVDPDNRRPVDYALRHELLTGLKGMNPTPDTLRPMLEDGNWQDGQPKLYLTWKALELRRERSLLFESGEYMPLEVIGDRAEHLVAFARRHEREVAITVAPRLCAKLIGDQNLLIPDPEVWSGTYVELPEDLSGTAFRNVFTGEISEPGEHEGRTLLPAEHLLQSFPAALLVSR
ncbi:MAG: malto-oligosyltrehalose synthase [Rubrobacteraceae bacterium]